MEIDRELLPVIDGYLENRGRDCVEIARLLASGGMDDITFLAHRMKGSGGSLGFDGITEIGADLERAGRSRDADGITSALERLERYLERVAVAYS